MTTSQVQQDRDFTCEQTQTVTDQSPLFNPVAAHVLCEGECNDAAQR